MRICHALLCLCTWMNTKEIMQLYINLALPNLQSVFVLDIGFMAINWGRYKYHSTDEKTGSERLRNLLWVYS